MSEEKGTTEDMWTPYKELQSLVGRYITSPPTTYDLQYHEFTEALRNHRQNFLTLLKNPPPNANSREEITKGSTDGITLPGLGHQLLSKELVDETLIISDMYELNEFMALDLLCTAQLQMPHHPGLPRGLTAILLYYDGKKALTATLRMLVQVRMGHSWKINAPIGLLRHITEYTNKLREDGLLDRILSLLEKMDPVKEQELLEKNRALGGPKHRYMVMKLYNDSRQDLADILYLWSAQSSLPNPILFRVISLLQSKQIGPDAAENGPDKVTLALIMSVLSAINFSSLHSHENAEELINTMPLIAERAHEELYQRLTSKNMEWESTGLRGLVQFAFVVALTTVKNVASVQSLNITNEDESLLEAALSNKCFHFMAEVLFKNKSVCNEEFYFRYFHSLISDFILLMPLKVKELRSRADGPMRLIQAYQQGGIEPPLNLDNHFEYLMLTVAELYKEDPLKLELVMDYWCLRTDAAHPPAPAYVNHLPSRQVALFKFVRLAGEILPAGLFVSYLKMIASLASSPQAAQQAFNFLKPNGSSGSTTTISWDHFFKSLSQYYDNLRKELPPSQDTVYRQRSHPKGITPEEVKGLEAVLLVVQVIARNDEVSRINICNNPGWKVLPSLIGLVSCGISIPLKSVLIRTLAALARSPESSSTVWQNLEAAQILSTIPTVSSYQPRGVQTELEEIESKKDEYPLTRAMLELLDVLTDFPVLRLLGMGQRNPGFDPYLHFIIDTVFLKFHTRSYKNPGEKWEVAEACLKIFSKLIKQYEPIVDDFTGCRVELQSGEVTSVNSAPGYHLMTRLHSKSELLHVVLYVLDKGCAHFDAYEPFPGKESLENAALYCLEILERGLKTQHAYMAQLAAAKSIHKIMTGLSRLLLEVDPRSKKPDYMINVAKYVSYSSWLPRHAFHAVGVVHEVTNEPGADSELLSTFTATPALTTGIRHGFVECLDADATYDDDDEATENEKQYTGSCKERILLLMMQSIARPTPNLSHYLLGFEITKNIEKTVLQQPGILGFPRTCLHSILAILEQSLGERGRDKIAEASYCFLHTLTANSKTSVPVLRFLRTNANQDFVQRHLSKLPFEGPTKSTELGCMSWLLKIAAIELRVAGGSSQNSLVQRLVGTFGRHEEEEGQIVPSQKLLMDMLHYIEFQLQPEPALSLDFFDPSQVEMVLGRCSVPVALIGGPRLVDIRKLHSLITDELAVTRNSATATQRNLMRQEVQKILTYALKRNQTKLLSYATVKFVEGWCQTTEILFCVTTGQQLPTPRKQNLLLNLSHDLLQKMTSCEALGEIKTLVSGTVLMLLVHLRNSFVAHTDNDESYYPSSPSNATMMKIVLGHVLQWILNAGGASSQKVTTHLYAALLNFLCVIGLEKSETTNVADLTYVGQLDSSTNRVMLAQERSHRYATIQVINGFGTRLMDVLCHSCSGGHDVCKMLALSCLDKILELDRDNAWIVYLTGRGYLKHMIDSLLESDSMLLSMLRPEPHTLRPLYLYEATMATFCRMASTRLGAESLLENKILSCVSSMTVFDHHPDVHMGFEGGDYSFVPSIGQRYQQILLPALYLCDALLTTLGTENQSCAVQICGFLQSHRDTVETVLRNASPNANELFSKEIACLTGVVSRSANVDIYKLVDEELARSEYDEQKTDDISGMRELRTHLSSLQRLMLSLLCKFQLRPAPIHLNHEQTEANQQHVSRVQIVANVMLYTRNQMQHSRMDQKISIHLTLKPGAREDKAKDAFGDVHLGAIVDQLVSVTNLLHTELPHVDNLIKKSAIVDEMNTSELKKYMSNEEAELDVQKQRIIVEQRLNRWVKEKRKTVKYCSLIIEHALYILWSHLDFYMTQVVSGHGRMQVSSGGIDESMVAWKVSSETLMELKQGLVSTFTDNFIKQLLDTHSEYATVDQGFVEALVRRIKRLLQFIM